MISHLPLPSACRRATAPLLLVMVGLFWVTGMPRPARAAQAFLLGQTETTITDVYFPWTQSSACACCICWETAEATIMAYWDDQRYQGTGPWERLLMYGNGFDEDAFRQTTDTIHDLSGVACGAGGPIGHTLFNYCGPIADIGLAFTNTIHGYSFSYDQDEWVWFGTDIKTPIAQGRPIYYVYYPEGSSGHAVVIVGYDDSDRTLFIYKNWAPVLSEKGFDEASEHCAIDFIPGGLASPPSYWICGASTYGRGDGCDCACGSYDPDCDDPAQLVKNCTSSEVCSMAGICRSTCQDQCIGGTRDCATATTLQICRDVNGDSCMEWELSACNAGETCNKGQCVPCVPECESGQGRCLDLSSYQICTVSSAGCGVWSAPELCAAGFRCQSGQCQACPGGDCTACEDECLVGETRCYGQESYQACVTGDQGCGVWSAPELCAAGFRCQSGQCQACPGGDCMACEDECTQEQTRCATEHAVQLCDGHSPLGCMFWSTWVPCQVGQQCLGGVCASASSSEGGCSLGHAQPITPAAWFVMLCLLVLLRANQRQR